MIPSLNKRLLILCEDGKSSQTYLKSFKKDEKLKRKLSAVSIEIYRPDDNSPLGLVNEAIKKQKQAKQDRNKYDDIWVVLDRDRHAQMPEALGLALNKKINFGLSVVCFEYWVLLHYEKTTHGFRNCAEIITRIKKNHLGSYTKGSFSFAEITFRIKDAIENGYWLEKQIEPDILRGKKPYELAAYTNLHRLVQKLIDPDKFLA